MLASATLQTLVLTSRAGEAEAFYSRVLGLPLVGRSHGALVYAVGSGQLHVCPVHHLQPSEHTVVGFAIEDLAAEMRDLAARGVRWERFPQLHHDHLRQDDAGIVTTSEGARVAWLCDPDGNLLSLVQYSPSAAPDAHSNRGQQRRGRQGQTDPRP